MIYRIRILEHECDGNLIKEHLAGWEEMKLLRVSPEGEVEKLNTYIETKRDELPCMKYYWRREPNATIEEGVIVAWGDKGEDKITYFENDDVIYAQSEKGNEILGRVCNDGGSWLVEWEGGETEFLFEADCYPIAPETADAYRRLRKEKDGIND